MKVINFSTGLLCIAVFFCSMGCRQKSSAQNKNYDEAKALAAKVQMYQDHNALNELMKGVSGNDFWVRTYSIEYLGQLLLDQKLIERSNVIDVLAKALDDSPRILRPNADPEQSIQHDIVVALANAGPDGVSKGLTKIKAFVLTFDDNSLSWSSVQALGLLTNQPQASEAVKVLVEALQHKTPNESVHEAPRLRDMALEALANIGTKNPVLVQTELEGVLSKLDAAYAAKASALIAQLKTSANPNPSTP